MPFHAAGVHRAGEIETAYQSIKVLAYSRKQIKNADTTNDDLLVVTMPTTPSKDHMSLPSLPGIMEEKRVLLGLRDGNYVHADLEKPTVEVVKRLQDCCIAHFACHGSTDH